MAARRTAKARSSRTRGKDPLARLRAICLSLPEANERISHGEPTWFAGKGRVFAMLDNHHHGAAHFSVWLPAGLGAQEALIESDPKRYFRPPYVGGSGWVGVVLDSRPHWGTVAWLVEQAYRLVAGRRLVAKLPLEAVSPRTGESGASRPPGASAAHRRGLAGKVRGRPGPRPGSTRSGS